MLYPDYSGISPNGRFVIEAPRPPAPHREAIPLHPSPNTKGRPYTAGNSAALYPKREAGPQRAQRGSTSPNSSVTLTTGRTLRLQVQSTISTETHSQS